MKLDKLSDEQLDWADKGEGQLSVDVYEHDGYMIVTSTIAGCRPEDLDISLHNDMLTIRGKRSPEHDTPEHSYFLKECYWGDFSRSIILPADVESDRVNADLKNGVLTIRLKLNQGPSVRTVGIDRFE